MQHAMIDLETFGTSPGCVIRSIGIVFFDPIDGEIGRTYYANLKEDEQIELGMHKDPATIAWWATQKKAEQQLSKDQISIFQMHEEISPLLQPVKNRMVWSQGSNFDTVLLEHMFRLMDRKTPWLYYNTRDTRTIYQCATLLTGFDQKSIQRNGTFHNALDDAIHQAYLVQAAFGKLKGKVNVNSL